MRPTTPLLALLLGLIAPLSVRAQWQPDGVGICLAPGTQRGVVAIPDGSGGAIAAWLDERAAVSTIHVQRQDAAGFPQWTPNGVPMSTTGSQSQYYESIVSDGAGGAIVVWAEARSLVTGPDLFAQRLNSSGDPQWAAGGVVVCSAMDSQDKPAVAADGAGGAIVVWYDRRNGFEWDVYAQRVSAAGAALWTSNGVVVSSQANEPDINEPALDIVEDGFGGAIAVWMDLRGGGFNHRIYTQRINAAGTAQWTPDGVMIFSSTWAGNAPVITTDGAGGAITVWYGGSTGTGWDILSQRVDGLGTPQWTANGAVLCNAPNAQTGPSITSNGAGGAIVAWVDERTGGANTDIYAQLVNGSGAPQWTPNGAAVCTAAGYQFFWHKRLAPNMAGGALIAWWDQRNGSTNSDIYVQSISAAGTAQLASDGVSACGAIKNQTNPAVVSDGSGGAIIAWEDNRGTSADIYAQHVLQPPTAVVVVPSLDALALQPAHPNPFTSGTEFEINLPTGSGLHFAVYDVAGRRVRAGSILGQKAGWRRVSFDGRSDAGQPLPSGVYFFRVIAGGTTATANMVIAR